MPALPLHSTVPARRGNQAWQRFWQHADLFVAGPLEEESGSEPLARQGRRLLWLDGLIANTSESFFTSFLGPFLLTFGATNTQIGILNSAMNAGAALGQLPGAGLVERVGQPKRIVVWTGGIAARLVLFMVAVAPLLFSAQAAIFAIITLVALRFFFNQLGFPAWSALASRLVPTRMRGRYFASRNIAMGAAALLFAPLAGVIIQLGGPPRGYQLSFALAGLVGFIATVVFARISEPAHEGRVVTSAAGATGASGAAAVRPARATTWSLLRGHPRFMAFTAVALLWNLSLTIVAPFFSVYMIRNLSAGPIHIGLLAATFSVWNIIGQRVWGRLNDRRGAAWVTRLSGLLIPSIPLIWTVVPNIWWLFPEESLSGFLWAGYGLASFNLVLSLSPESQRARFVAIYQVVGFAAAFVGPLIGSFLADALTIRGCFFFSAGGRFLAALLFLFTVRGDSETA
jgi:MFS family permease